MTPESVHVDIEFCRELCEAFLRRYTNDPEMPNSVKEFQWLATHEFNTRFRNGEISNAEFGVIIDMILSY
jgi:hypothetical protein